MDLSAENGTRKGSRKAASNSLLSVKPDTHRVLPAVPVVLGALHLSQNSLCVRQWNSQILWVFFFPPWGQGKEKRLFHNPSWSVEWSSLCVINSVIASQLWRLGSLAQEAVGWEGSRQWRQSPWACWLITNWIPQSHPLSRASLWKMFWVSWNYILKIQTYKQENWYSVPPWI